MIPLDDRELAAASANGDPLLDATQTNEPALVDAASGIAREIRRPIARIADSQAPGRLFQEVVTASLVTNQLSGKGGTMLYVQDSFRQSDVVVMHDFMQRYSFATIVSCAEGIHVSHLPVLLDRQRGPYGTIVGHLARANAQWRDFDGQRSATCIFHGPHAYISPTWYTERPAVPTWNYAVVHAIGTPTAIEDPERLAQIIEQTLGTFEPALRDPNADGHLPDAYRARLLKAIVGFEMPIERLDGKFKLGQNRSAADQAGIKAALEAQGGSASELLDLMR